MQRYKLDARSEVLLLLGCSCYLRTLSGDFKIRFAVAAGLSSHFNFFINRSFLVHFFVPHPFSMINDRGGLAIATLIFYVLAILASLLLCRKHGFGRNGGWIFLMIFSLIRVAGSIAELVAVNDPSVASVTAATALAGSGFSALLMAEIGVLQRL